MIQVVIMTRYENVTWCTEASFDLPYQACFLAGRGQQIGFYGCGTFRYRSYYTMNCFGAGTCRVPVLKMGHIQICLLGTIQRALTCPYEPIQFTFEMFDGICVLGAIGKNQA